LATDALADRLAQYAHLVVQARAKSAGRRRIYVGRGKGKRGRFGTPFTVQDDSEAERLRVITAFDRHVAEMDSAEMDPAEREPLLAEIREHLAAGGVLACWCSPRLGHGQVWCWWALEGPPAA
jgi:hypothetical protein